MNSCPICNGTIFEPTKIGFTQLLHCTTCNVHVLEQLPQQEELESYYSAEYIMSEAETLASEHRRIFRMPEQYWLVSQLEEYGLSSGATILDIGCDKGYFIDQARRFGYQVQGVEPSYTARSYCEKAGIQVYASMNEIDGKFDAITMWHVLEHFTNPQGLISECANKLRTDGLLFIRVPDFESRWSKLLRSYWIWFQPKNHYIHYSKSSLTMLVEQHGFETIKCMSRKPNNSITFKAGLLADNMLRKHFKYGQSFKKILGRLYEHFTGVEIYLIARKK